MYKKIHLSTYEEYVGYKDRTKQYRTDAQNISQESFFQVKLEKRKNNLIIFPFSAVLQGAYPEHDYATRWCWQKYGSPQTECCMESYSEYPSCPEVLATERFDDDGDRAYSKVKDHSHIGCWTHEWVGKTGYDYGFSEFYFKAQSDLDSFLAAVETFNFGENYAKEDK